MSTTVVQAAVQSRKLAVAVAPYDGYVTGVQYATAGTQASFDPAALAGGNAGQLKAYIIPADDPDAWVFDLSQGGILNPSSPEATWTGGGFHTQDNEDGTQYIRPHVLTLTAPTDPAGRAVKAGDLVLFAQMPQDMLGDGLVNDDGYGTALVTFATADAETPSAAPKFQVEPAFGTVKGGNLVHLVGRNLTGITDVLFGDAHAPEKVFLSDGEIQVRPPSRESAGSDQVDVTVRGVHGEATADGDQYTYVYDSTPASGPVGTVVTVTGPADVIDGVTLVKLASYSSAADLAHPASGSLTFTVPADWTASVGPAVTLYDDTPVGYVAFNVTS